MKVINTVELKNHTNEILRLVRRGRPVAVTLRGKPSAAIIPLTEENLDDFIFEYSPEARRLIEEAEADVRAGRVITWQTFLEHEAKPRASRWESAAALEFSILSSPLRICA